MLSPKTLDKVREYFWFERFVLCFKNFKGRPKHNGNLTGSETLFLLVKSILILLIYVHVLCGCIETSQLLSCVTDNETQEFQCHHSSIL